VLPAHDTLHVLGFRLGDPLGTRRLGGVYIADGVLDFAVGVGVPWAFSLGLPSVELVYNPGGVGGDADAVMRGRDRGSLCSKEVWHE